MTVAVFLTILVLFGVSLLFGLATAVRHGLNAWWGVAFGVVAWLAVVLAYMVVLTIFDWRTKKMKPDLIGVPTWVPPLIWVCFVAATLAAVALYRRIHIARRAPARAYAAQWSPRKSPLLKRPRRGARRRSAPAR